jgi:5'-nucleotidase
MPHRRSRSSLLGRSFLLPAFGVLTLACSVATSVAACSTGEGTGGDDSHLTGVVDVQILAINDFHGNLQPPGGSTGSVTADADDPIVTGGAPDGGIVVNPDAGTALVPAGGAAYLATHVKRLRAENPHTAVVSAGDLTGASPLLSNLFKDEPAVLAMNAIGLDFEGVGNHDFDRGITELLRLQNGGCSLGDCNAGNGRFEGAKYKYLAANVESTGSGQTIFPPYAIKDFGGARVAFVGMTLEKTPSVTVASAVAGLEFQNEVETVNALVPQLKKEGASAIVVLLHQGGGQAPTGTYDSCESLTGDILSILQPPEGQPKLDPAVDVIVSAHTHQAYNCSVDGRLVTSAASFGRVVTKIDLKIDVGARKIVDKSAHNVPVTRDVALDPEVSSLIAKYEAAAAPLANRVVGYVAADITKDYRTAMSPSCETPLGDVIADAQLAATAAPGSGSAVLAFMNPGGIRTDLVVRGPTKTEGTITYAEAFAVQPFANNLVTMTLTGAQIQTVLSQQFAGATPKILQVSGNLSYEYSYDAATHVGTIDPASIRLGGAALDPAASYRVTVNAFLAGGGDAFAAFKEGIDRLTGVVDLDALTATLAATSPERPLAPPALTRIRGNGCPL